MTTFVLVHGAFGSPAELAPVLPELQALGHRALTVDLPCTDPAATLEDYASTVVEAMSGIEGPVAVVGHSAGGATISLVPERAHVDHLVYVTTFVPEPGALDRGPRRCRGERDDHGRSATCSAATPCAPRTTSCRPRSNASGLRAWASSPSSSPPTTRSSRSARASSHGCWWRRPIHVSGAET